MAKGHKFETFEQALDEAIHILSERFGKPDQGAAIQLANAIYALQERERFEERVDSTAEAPYQG